MTFDSKEAIVSAIKQFHYDHGFNYAVEESKVDKHVG